MTTTVGLTHRISHHLQSSSDEQWNKTNAKELLPPHLKALYFICSAALYEHSHRKLVEKKNSKMKSTRENKRVPKSLLAVLFLQTCLTTNAFVPTQVRQSSQRSRLPQTIGDENEESSLPSNSVASEGITFSPGEATLRLGISSAPTVWTEFGRIAQEYDPINLGQGFPDWLPPKFAVDSLVEAVLDSAQSPHQYTRPAGHPNLVQQLARRYSIHLKQEIKPMEEVAVTVGASQALYLSLQTLIKPGK